MKAPYIFMNEKSEYFYIFPNVFFSKSRGAFFANKKNNLWPYYLKYYFLRNSSPFYLMGYGLAPCEGFSNDKISKERVKIEIRKLHGEMDISCMKKGKESLNRLPMDYLTPEKLFKFINYTMS